MIRTKTLSISLLLETFTSSMIRWVGHVENGIFQALTVAVFI